jgi:hypothetical protein
MVFVMSAQRPMPLRVASTDGIDSLRFFSGIIVPAVLIRSVRQPILDEA